MEKVGRVSRKTESGSKVLFEDRKRERGEVKKKKSQIKAWNVKKDRKRVYEKVRERLIE